MEWEVEIALPKTTNLLVVHYAAHRALAQITEHEMQVVIRLIPFGAEHASIHAQTGGGLLKTWWAPNKPPSSWDDARVSIARAMGLENPEKHRDYVDHRPLVEPYLFDLGDHLVGRRIEFASLSAKAKYKKNATTAAWRHDPAIVQFYFR